MEVTDRVYLRYNLDLRRKVTGTRNRKKIDRKLDIRTKCKGLKNLVLDRKKRKKKKKKENSRRIMQVNFLLLLLSFFAHVLS